MGLQSDDKKFLLEQFRCIAGCIANNSLDTSNLELLIQQLINEKDFELKSLPLEKYCCEDGSTYSTLICKKFEDNIEVSSETIIYQTAPVLELLTELPECAKPCVIKEEECKKLESLGTLSDFSINDEKK